MKLHWLRDRPPFCCFFGCGRSLDNKFGATAHGWEWFTEYADGPFHFCPQCRRTRQFEIDHVRARLHVHPTDYPNQRWSEKDARDALRAFGG